MEAEIPKIEHTPDQIADVNLEPRSNVRNVGTPNLEIHVSINDTNTGLCGDGGQRNNLRPSSSPVHHGEKILVAMTKR